MSITNKNQIEKCWAIDLETGWDLTKVEHRNEVVRLVLNEKPTLVIGSPPCTKMSTLQNLNPKRWENPKFCQEYKEAVAHVNFCCYVYGQFAS